MPTLATDKGIPGSEQDTSTHSIRTWVPQRAIVRNTAPSDATRSHVVKGAASGDVCVYETHRANSKSSLLRKVVRGRLAMDSDSYLKRSYARTHTVNSVKLERYSARTAV